jgi:hypothetical protein
MRETQMHDLACSSSTPQDQKDQLGLPEKWKIASAAVDLSC